MVCKPEQLLQLKSKYGEVLTFSRHGELDRVITMFYITVSSRYYGKYDNTFFNLIYGARTFTEAVKDSFGVDYAQYFLLIDPKHIFDPTLNTRVFNPIKTYLYNGFGGDMLFGHEGVYLPNHSYAFLQTPTIRTLWEKVISLIKEHHISPLEFSKLSLSELYDSIKTPERVYNLQIPTFNITTWEEYVQLVHHIQYSSQDLREFFYRCCQFTTDSLLKSKMSKSLLECPFDQKIVTFNPSTKLWFKTRKELRKK